ncbi:hypothetical protein [Miltoncostaea marina]|uniref:hypothetical protein n=1 Tax=Miltoncostaea marina TaxID=2843215 RepID=UPI001C3D37C1|nr:hypothetical protein [Miltoncostaea marina]
MSARRWRTRPADRRTVILALLLSLLLPGLGHAYTYRLPRALVWLGGTIVVGLVVGDGDRQLALGMGVALAVLAALDIALVMWLDHRGTRRR